MPSNPLALRIEPQRSQNLCWAAVAASLANFLSRALPDQQVDQLTVVERTLGLGAGACKSNNPPPECDSQCALADALRQLGILADRGPDDRASVRTFAEVKAQIDAGLPLGVEIGWETGGNHFIAIVGYTDEGSLLVADPSTDFDGSPVPFVTLLTSYPGAGGVTGKWTVSYYTKTEADVS
jgi:Papain-like cysteine protease AvrRpt2